MSVEQTSIEQLTSGQQAAGATRASFGDDAVIACDSLVRIYSTAGIEVQALQGLDLLIEPGELTALVGASGSGKSTLLNILAGLDTPTAGRARVAGHDLLGMGSRERLAYRRQTVGFLWQQTSRNLFSHLTAAENVALPMRLAAKGRRTRQRRTTELLGALGVGYCQDRMPAQMSGGEQQRVAIGVALANEPAVLLADEPTGELDTATGEEVFAALRTANTDLGVTILVVTHDQQVSEQVRRTIAIRDGRISTEVLRHTATDEHGQEADVAQEYAVLDRAGRLQIPRDFIETLGMRDRVLLALESDHVGVWPDAAGRDRATGPAGAPPGPRPPRTRWWRASPGRWAGRSMTGTAAEAVQQTKIVRVEEVTRSYGSGATEVHALRGVSFTITRGELVALRGRSGSGKTTLLSIIGGLERPSSGRVEVDGEEVTAMSPDGVARMLRERVAFIFQSFGLLPVLSAAENVGLPMRLARLDPAARERRAVALLDLVGLAGHAGQRPYELSGGEQQRVAIARALANNPRLLLADEPTGQLDLETARQIMRLIRSIAHGEGITAIVATHDNALIELADRVLELKDGRLIGDSVAAA